MKKSYYFPHEYNASRDPKIISLIGNYGGLGYGVYWMIIEMMHQENDHKLPLKFYIYEAIAKQMQVEAKLIEAIVDDCVNKFELFQKSNNYFWSNRVLRNIDEQLMKNQTRVNAGRIGGIQSGKKRSKTKQKTKQNEAKRKTCQKSNLILQKNEALLQANEANEANETKRKENKINKNIDIDIDKQINLKNFIPKNKEEFLCQEIAVKLKENSINFILSALKKHGFTAIQRAYNDTLEMSKITKIENPGAYFNQILQRL